MATADAPVQLPDNIKQALSIQQQIKEAQTTSTEPVDFGEGVSGTLTHRKNPPVEMWKKTQWGWQSRLIPYDKVSQLYGHGWALQPEEAPLEFPYVRCPASSKEGGQCTKKLYDLNFMGGGNADLDDDGLSVDLGLDASNGQENRLLVKLRAHIERFHKDRPDLLTQIDQKLKAV